MAKKTKAADLSIEEKLEQALVVPGYEPYKIPDNWCWTTLEYAAKWGSGGTPSRKISDYYLGDIPWIKTGELDNDFVYETEEHISEEAIRNSSAKLYPVNTVMIAMYGATIGKVGIMGVKATTNQACANAVCGKNIYYKYLFYYAISQKDSFISKGKGGAQPNISQEVIKKHEFPLPPLPEQHRIVERIESLFSKLDEAKKKAQEVIDSFETRKAAILHKAFSGELTAKWREENGVGIESWKRKTLGEVCNSIFDGDHMPPPKSESGIPFLVISDVNDGYLSFENTRFVPQEYYDAITDTRKPEKGDVLYTLVGSFGIPVVVDTNAPFCFQRHMALLKPKSINTYFLWYLLQSQEMYQKASSIAKGVAQLTVPIKGLRLMDFNCPSEEEQIEIVRILDSLLEKEDTSKDNAESIIDKIETMKKAILARAFRGELGTNDPEEESAVELLKEILSGNNNKEESKKQKRTRIVIPKEIDSLLKTELERKIIKLFLKSSTGELTAEEIMAVSSKKFDILNTIRILQKQHLIIKSGNKNYTKYTLVR